MAEDKPKMGESGGMFLCLLYIVISFNVSIVLMEFPEIRQAPHFPLVRKECKEKAAKFFHCLTTKSFMGNDYV